METQVQNKRRFSRQLSFGRKVLCFFPYFWILLFLFIPFLVLLKFSVSGTQTSIPPYMDLLKWVEGVHIKIVLNLENYLITFQNGFYLQSFLKSLQVAIISTFFCLLIGYPIAYFIARAPKEKRIVLLLLVILPLCISFLIRVYSWMGLLKGSGIINSVLLTLGLIQEPLPLTNSDFAICSGIVYSYLPFMILSLYVAIKKIDPHIPEAAYDLGCGPIKAFLKITLPLSLPGIILGSMFVLIPALGEVIIPFLLGGADYPMIGKVIWQEFFNNENWPLASALTITLLTILLFPIVILNHMGSKIVED